MKQKRSSVTFKSHKRKRIIINTKRAPSAIGPYNQVSFTFSLKIIPKSKIFPGCIDWPNTLHFRTIRFRSRHNANRSWRSSGRSHSGPEEHAHDLEKSSIWFHWCGENNDFTQKYPRFPGRQWGLLAMFYYRHACQSCFWSIMMILRYFSDTYTILINYTF